jgi:hypothetical protein
MRTYLSLDPATLMVGVAGSVIADLGVSLEIITLACGVIGSAIAFFGEAVRKPKPTTPSPGLLSRITWIGWISMALLIIAFIAGVWSKVDSEAYQQSLLTKLTNSENDLQKVRSDIGDVTLTIGVIGKQLSNPVDAQLETLVIRQEVHDNPPKEPGDRNNKLVTFYVDVKKENSANKNKLFARIKKVIYHFDQRWFSDKPVVAVDNITEDFQYSMRVWGSTRFYAEILTSDPERRILRTGYIDTMKTALFED